MRIKKAAGEEARPFEPGDRVAVNVAQLAKRHAGIEAGLDDKRIVLTRKPGEQISIAIGDTTILVELHSLRARAARAARLAITAPRNVEIMRGELVAGYEEEGEQT